MLAHAVAGLLQTPRRQALNLQFAHRNFDGVVFFSAEGAPSAKARLRCGSATAEVYLYGAHCVSWKLGDTERLWMSSLSKLDGSAPIRGGVPLAFPQFATQGPLPLHGFARERVWSVRESGQSADGVFLTLGLADDEVTRAAWPHKFSLEYTVTLSSSGSIKFDLGVQNTDSEAWSFTNCLPHQVRAIPVVQILDEVPNVPLLQLILVVVPVMQHHVASGMSVHLNLGAQHTHTNEEGCVV